MNRREFLGGAATASVLLAAAPDAFARRNGGLPVALVTADTESHVAVIRLTDGRLQRKLATRPDRAASRASAGPRSWPIPAAARSLWSTGLI